jgi:hypothetical protein
MHEQLKKLCRYSGIIFYAVIIMKLNDDLQQKLAKVYEPSSFIQMKFRGNNIGFKTDDKGNAVLLFIGKAGADRQIKGNRYARVLKYDTKGNKIKDHWELKGKAT